MSCLDQLQDNAKFELLKALHTNNFFYWVGSGFSRNFGFPSWGEVLKEIAKKIGYEGQIDEGQPLRTAELLCSYAAKEKKYDEYKFNSLVSKTLYDLQEEDVEPEWIKEFTEASPDIIVTTNWDNVLEEIHQFLPNIIIRGDVRPSISRKSKNIFKIHGDAGRPDSIVITQSQYNTFQREDTYLNRKIYTLFTEVTPVFIGYSLTDPNIAFLYDEVYAHYGEEKSSSFMIIHPSEKEEKIQETKLLFENKRVHLIVTEIGKFIEDCAHGLEEFRKSNDLFWIEHEKIKERLEKLVSRIVDRKTIREKTVLRLFTGKESGQKAIKAFVDILNDSSLYSALGGNVLSPENRIPYKEADEIISIVIWLLNKYSHPDIETRNEFYRCVYKICTTGPDVWDFYYAGIPFQNILQISPTEKSDIFDKRINHIREILRWSAPKTVGKCWGTWSVYSSRISWLKERDINALINIVEKDSENGADSNDRRWLTTLHDSDVPTKIQKKKIEKLL